MQKAQLAADYGKLPLSFEANEGQTDGRVKFLSRGSGYGLYLTSDEAVLALNGHPCKSGAPAHSSQSSQERNQAGCGSDDAVVTMRLAGRANLTASLAGEEPLPGTANYFVGGDPAAWRTAVPTYAKVRYTDVYPGVDLLYYGNQRQLEYDFAVAPHADPRAIRLQFSGVTKLKLDPDGDLIVSAKNGDIAFRKPVIYQERDGRRDLIAGRFTLGRRHTVSFALNDYDHSRPLIIDPVLAYSTYLGGSGINNGDAAFAIAVDSSGDAYVTGMTDSVNFPLTSGSYQQTNKGAANSTFNAFVTKMNATGTALVYSTYLGGSATTQALALAVDGSGSAYVTGMTFATDFPTTSGAYQTASVANSAGYTAFVTKLNAAGTALEYSTYLGGSGNGGGTGDTGNAIAVDSSSDVYVAGATYSANFPVTAGAYQTTNRDEANNQQSAFVTKLNASGSALVYSTYLGGSAGNGQSDVANALAVDGSGDVYLTGQAGSSDFPTTAGAYQTTNPASANSTTVAFVSELNPSGSSLLYSTFLGGSEGASGSALAVDASGDAYVTGFAKYTDFPVTAGAFQATNNGSALNVSNAFVAKLNPTGSALLYSTYLGGSGLEISAFDKDGDSASGLVVDAAGDAYVTGVAFSSNFPVTSGAYQTTNNGSANSTYNAFVTELNPTGAALLYSTFIGGSGFPFGSTNYYRGDDAMGLAIDASDNLYITGIAYSADYPVTKGPFQSTNRAIGNSGSNVFISKLSLAGQIPAAIATTTTLTSSASPVAAGTSVTFTAAVVASSGTTVPTGNVVFAVDGSAAATVALASGSASYSTSTLAVGSHTVTANYEGSAAFSSSSASATQTVNAAEQPATAPAFSPAVGTYNSAQSVTLSDATTGAAIYYTTNGTTPTTSSTLYTGAIAVSASETIEAIAVAGGYTNSVVASGAYAITPTAAAPTFPVAIGTYTSAQSVTIAEATSGASVYYTTDTTTPTTSSAKYTAAIQLATSTTVKAIAVASGYNNSPVAAATYNITPPAATPTFSLAAGTYTSTQSVTLTDTTTGATIYYTTNGTIPTTSSTVYTGPISVNTTETIEAIAAAPGYVSSQPAGTNYTVTQPQAQLLTPAPGSVLTGSGVTFTWTTGAGVTAYGLWLGLSGPGSSSLYSSGSTTATSVTVSSLPGKGATVYARLFSVIGGKTQYIDYTYIEATVGTAATMVSPGSGSTLGSSNVKFTWTTGTGATQYDLVVGLSGPGSGSLYNSGWVTTTSLTVPSVPAKGATVYARLYSDVYGVTEYNDYTYTEGIAGIPATMISPSQANPLGTSNVKFTWTTGTETTQYDLVVGLSGPGSGSLYNSGWVTTTSLTVPSVPAKAATVYVRLYSDVKGATEYNDYTYTEAAAGIPATMISPMQGNTLGTSNVQFTWTPGTGATQYNLLVGLSGPGSGSLYNMGWVTTTSATVPSVPAKGATVYVRLYSDVKGATEYNDYTYTEQ
jgi:hypothetical protein